MIPPDLLAMLRCPLTGQTLTLADEAALQRINAGSGGHGEVTAALLRADGKAAFPVQDDIPVLLREAIIVL